MRQQDVCARLPSLQGRPRPRGPLGRSVDELLIVKNLDRTSWCVNGRMPCAPRSDMRRPLSGVLAANVKLRFAGCLLPVLLGACAPLQAYRTEAPGTALATATPCTIVDDSDAVASTGLVASECASRIREDSDRYRLYFAEFDDQGWTYPESASYGSASKQSEILVADLLKLLEDPAERLSIVVFAHGWKHTAATADTNVRAFRRLLSDLAAVEKSSVANCPRRIIGVYVGWRGAASTLGDPLENLTFWNRKEAAQRVAQGDVRVLFSHLRTIQDNANDQWNDAITLSRKAVAQNSQAPTGRVPGVDVDPCLKRVRLSFAGHSFGGGIIYTSIAQALIRDVVELGHAEAAQQALPAGQRVRPILQREGDLVVVVNPAIEATRFEPLYRAVTEARLPHYHTPIFVGITSTEDRATKEAFPVGRWLSTRFDKYPEESVVSERSANQRTFGQADEFLTHDLSALPLPAGSGNCSGWLPTSPLADRLAVEERVLGGFRAALERLEFDGSTLTQREFCGLQTLRLTTRSPWAGNSPVWNVQTHTPVVRDHNDFENPLLLDLLRQLYIEAEDRSLVRLRAGRPR
jgi:hypothetical protein